MPRSRALAFLSFAACLLLSLPWIACAPSPEAPPSAGDHVADLVLVGGKIHTLDDAMPEAEALAAKDGRIVAVGARAEVEGWIGDGTEVIDLAGRTAIPGFIEGHGHFMGLGDSRIQLDLRGAASWEEIVEQVAAAAAEAEPGAWIRGRGWHQDKWSAAPDPAVEGFPVHPTLSAVSPDNPVLLTHASGHALFANAKAMELAGVDASTPNPPGGDLLHGADGEPTGLFRETAMDLIHRVRGEMPPESELRRMVELASEETLRKGVTSFHDAGSSFETVDFLKRMADDGTLGVRLWIMVRAPNDQLREKMASAKVAGYADGMLSVGGIKVSLDGALGSRGAWLLEPYTDSPGSVGLNLVPVEEVEETAEIAIEEGVQLCIHAIGDRANREVLDIFEKTFAAHPDKSDLRWRVEHAQHLHPDDLSRFAALKVVASMQAVHCTSDGPWVPDRLGERRSEEGAYMWRSLIDSGALVINGTDVPVEDVDPIAGFYSSITREMVNGERFYPAQSMTRREALRSYTLDVAKAAFEEDEKGSLEVGKLADVVVLSQDILSVDEEAVPDTKIVYTLVGGKVVHRGEI